MSQSKKLSLFETLTSTAIGYGAAVLTQLLVFPLFGIAATLQDNLAIGAIFTAVSIARGYMVRRLFNRLQTTSLNKNRLDFCYSIANIIRNIFFKTARHIFDLLGA